MRGKVNGKTDGNDLGLLMRAAGLIRAWHRRTAFRAAAQMGTAQVLHWQSLELCDASARIVTEAERLVAQSKRSRKSLRLIV
jgi:hypothetical protein